MQYSEFQYAHADSDYLGYDGCIMFPGLRVSAPEEEAVSYMIFPVSKITSGSGVEFYTSVLVDGIKIYIDLCDKFTYAIYCNW